MPALLVEITTVLANLAIVAAAIVGTIQLRSMATDRRLHVHAVRADHDRRKKQATVEFHDLIRSKSQPVLREIHGICGSDPVTVDQVLAHPELEEAISDLLSLMERFSCGIHTDVYDLGLYRLLYQNATIIMYHQLHEYIQYSRKKRYSSLWIQFEMLVRILEADSTKATADGTTANRVIPV